ncbi:anthranilate synthase component I family protein [Methanospirillum sp. J.3.6.1-F.2.7.3]|uniref:Anthranilate synthase component 1 n=1 Tax=Methanospirillum purgamenti TaxID=2834276 RepID=A0A8E7EIB6_9EURY|nr:MULTISPECIES: anthranilate synthase component I family protein [Methanospirillum]MDX8550816.1 anthranilate synthase component I family protein [Methanospirillum hungatei]QVV89952.1 anthranilate synthase component I family protein [Methanospirillum sp. J.3.6.1-F.2.7.3]
MHFPEGDAGGMEAAMTAGHIPEIMSFSTYEEIITTLKKPAYVPVSMNVPEPRADPAAIYADLETTEGFLLESMEGVPKRAVRSIIGIRPLASLSISETLEVTGEYGDVISDIVRKDGNICKPSDVLRRIYSTISGYTPDRCTFTGGMAGYCRYDLVSSITDGMVKAGTEEGPVIRLQIPGELIIFDHVAHSCTLIAGTMVMEGDDIQQKYQDAVRKVQNLHRTISTSKLRKEVPLIHKTPLSLPDHDRILFEEAVEKALNHIRAGDIFQVVLSRQVSLPYDKDPYTIYKVLRQINPSPYLYYFHFGDEAIIGSSPEMLVKTEGKMVTTVPIAGTRPRGKTDAEDDALARDLLSDPKERAEHLMLVDLARNDIGRVSEFGTVKVSEFMSVEKFSHVQHITSIVTGELQEDKDPVDALEACFPAGTVSGAPKIRAMQIIQDLEPVSRGLYSGAVGYLGFQGLMEFAIAIRTVIIKNNIATCQAGAGIVADSVPSREFEETQAKAGAMAQAIFAAGELS